MTSQSKAKWEQLLKEQLLNSGMLDGVAVLTNQGSCVYQCGYLDTLPKATQQQFTGVFKYATPQHDEMVCAQGLTLPFCDGVLKFKIYAKTFTSMYAVSEDGIRGLIACSLPYGVFLCTYRHPYVAEDVVDLVEHFCDQLRA